MADNGELQTDIVPTEISQNNDGELNVDQNRSLMRTGRFNRQIGNRTIVVFPGDDIQKAFDTLNDSNGGTVLLKAGTHKPGKNLTMYKNTHLLGETKSVVLDFNNGSYGITAAGSNAYTTGTIAINKGSSTVTGTGTTFTSAMVGRHILISGIWYLISGYTSTTVITISVIFTEVSITGGSYVIASTIDNLVMDNLTIQNSTTDSVSITYGNNVIVGQMFFLNCTTGLKIQNSCDLEISGIIGVGCGIAVSLISGFNGLVTGLSIISSTDIGMNVSSCQFLDFTSSNITGSTNNGISVTGCSYVTFGEVATRYNGAYGVELVSGNSFIQFNTCAFITNTSDGLKLTLSSSNCGWANCQFVNGLYGWNIADAGCSNNFANQNHFVSNASGRYTDSGTTTNINEGGLAGTKVYYVSDSSGGLVTRKLTFLNGILISET